MKVFLMFLGGSGTKCAEAFLHAGILTGGAGSGPVAIATQILDPDTNTPTQAKFNPLPGNYGWMRERWQSGQEFFAPGIRHRGIFSPHAAVDADQGSTLASLLDCNSPLEEDLLRILLTEDQHQKNLRHGLYGWPNLGAAVWNHWLAQDGVPGQKEIADALNQNEAVRVVLVGSIFGGTGASGVPTLARNLSRQFGSRAGFELHGLALTPYFAPPPGGPSARIKAEQNPLRAKHVFKGLGAAECGFRSLHFLGLDKPKALPVYEEDRQDNPTSEVERVAAWLLWTLHCSKGELPQGIRVLGVQNPEKFTLAELPAGADFESAIQRNALAFAFMGYEYGHYWKQRPQSQEQALLGDTLKLFRGSLEAWLEGPYDHLLKKGESLAKIMDMLTLAPEPTGAWPELFKALESKDSDPWSVFKRSHKDMAFDPKTVSAFQNVRNAINA